MSTASLSIVQPKSAHLSLPKGTLAFEELKDKILGEFAAKVPLELRLPQALIDDPPKDVSNVPQESGILSAKDLEITDQYDAVALAEAIASKKLTAVEVATAFAKRAIIAHQLTCCLVDWFMDEAIERARSLDRHLEETGMTVGPLHGVPISIKEHMPLAGHYSATGYWDTRVLDTEDCQMMAILRDAGAVFYCKTLQPQSIMHLETVSLLGRTLNPFNIQLTAGGSTGGEAALIAMRGSVLGVGTDIGGSVRCPAGVCGIYGFKPTSYTLPMSGFLPEGFGAELNVLCSTGPMCTSLRDMDLFMRVLTDAKPYLSDPRLIPIPWTGLSGAKKLPLKIGFMMNDGVIKPQPPVTKALLWAKGQLEKTGSFEVKDFKPFKVAEAMKNIRLAYWPDGGQAVKAHLASTGEPMLPLTKWIIKDAEGEDIGTTGVLRQRIIRDLFRAEFSSHWTEQDVDVVISPAFVGPACSHETAFYWNYTAFWNYVDCPGVCLPTPFKAGKKGTEDYSTDEQTPLSEECKHVRQLWAEGDFEGAPIDIQVCARKYHDNDLFAALEVMKDALQF
ncbi:unnamed protein product [Clonostachys chloroleuca]|uniref:Amidase domain-containing protein n=1 Tax=Clonostachys chloroleuca TaxID=1926264 RepID=A0AA35PXX0_9HYPO|nr:unnamed protein product [Clonostachys chloroleuca]